MKTKGLISINTSYFFRGIAILMVIFSHYFEWGESFITSEKLVHFITSLGDYGVGIFFFLSGYALYKGYGNKNTDYRYVIKRITNMYLPYLLIASLIAIMSDSLKSFADFALLLFGGGYWFITVIIIIYTAFYFVGKLPSKYRVILMMLFIIDLSLWYYLSGHFDFWYTANWAFAFGMLICKHEDKLRLGNTDFSIDIKDYVFSFLGKLTIYIYVLHSFVYFKVINIQGLQDLNWYIKTLIAVLVTAITAFIIDKIFHINKIFLRNKEQ